ncbi:MAG: UDP-N-acetylmuramoyl-L-alanyl-D-glutamate--2,6-diaminopimelate ligase [Planctomyces sp.]|nr:UDP-N-acetylmuramoyl-L-alanyl-D-glutamate--2,6-diaminopimelate ligase [Planctomyces sp.]
MLPGRREGSRGVDPPDAWTARSAHVQLDRLIDGLPIRPAAVWALGGRQGVGAGTGSGGGGGMAGGWGARALSSVRITDITEDHRTALPGSLFVARRGQKFDGRTVAAQAVRAGAVVVLVEESADLAEALPAGSLGQAGAPAIVLTCPDLPGAVAAVGERFYGSPSGRLACMGVTGTNGKTTVAWLVHQLLNGAGLRCGLMGTVCVDDGTEVAPAVMTTPPALEISRTLARMLEAGCVAAAMEASSHALDQRRVAGPGGVGFRVGVFTNLTHDHLDYHGDMGAYAAAKARLFASLGPDGAAVVNADDPWQTRMLDGCRARVVRCTMRWRRSGAEPAAEWSARVDRGGLDTTRVAFSSPSAGGSGGSGRRVEWTVDLPLIGAHNVFNAMQAAAAALELGLDLAAVQRGLGAVAAPPGRLERVSAARGAQGERGAGGGVGVAGDEAGAGGARVLVDYAHTDDALRRVLGLLRRGIDEAGAGRLWVVFGCGGDRDRSKRPKMGAAAAGLADRLIITSDNPRTEDARSIAEQVLAGVPIERRAATTLELDRRAAIWQAVTSAGRDDVVLIAGKGHETAQVLPDGLGGTISVEFDDRQVARQALAALGRQPAAAARRAPAASPRRHAAATRWPDADADSHAPEGPTA